MPKPEQLNLDESKPIYKNKLLFTEHFLEHRIKEDAEWEKAHEGARIALEKLRVKIQEIHPENLKEAQLEENWVQWIFTEILAQPYAVQINLTFGDGKHGIPDYALMATKEEAAALGREIHNPESIKAALALAEAKAWGVNLDKATKDNPSPAKQLDNYLYYSELPWGILTDGCYWRLYERSRSKWNEYYEVNLPELIERNDINDFLYFYLFFRREAFATGWLNTVLKGSQEFAEAVRDSLEEQVFSALEDIAQGFLDYRRNRMEKPPSATTLAQIYQESLVLLYRLLFIFYAESRGILPMQNDDYKQRSLASIAKDAENRVKFPAQGSADDSKLHSRMDDLFFIIDAGDERSGIPAYNGKLFNQAEHAFLSEKKIGDSHLAPAIYKLATLEVNRGRGRERVSVDYQDLEVSHLGTIYEKLLEYQLDFATEALALGRDETYKPATGNQRPVKEAGDVYLRTGNNQRKVTGSYYTPDYIVRFIVEKTLQPLLLEITGRYASPREDGSWLVNDAPALRDAILSINVLDPATGSGHFAVDVVSYIADWLSELALELPENESSDEGYWMRQVAANCIYAVDINPLAVELAKLSIWLKTVARDKPLSFLDHHIRVGNSLVGASLAEIEDLAPSQPKPKSRKKVAEAQAPLFGEDVFTKNVQGAVSRMKEIEGLQAQTVKDVKRQEAIYDEMRERLRPYEQLANIWTAREFGLALKDGEWEAVYKLTLANQQTPRVREIVEAADTIAKEREMRFFHWDLAFPEVFFDNAGQRRKDAGFDAVVGNPPYVRYQNFSLPLKKYIENQFEIYNGAGDLFLYFFEMGLSYLRESCRLGYVSSGTYMNSSSAKKFREYIHKNAAFDIVINFGENQPFKEAEMVYPTIAIIRNGKSEKTFKSLFIEDVLKTDALAKTISGELADTLSNITGMDEWRFQPLELTNLFNKISIGKKSLKEAIKGEIYYGILTGFNDAFLIDEVTRKELISKASNSAEIIVPMVRGQDLRPWYQKFDSYLILAKQGIDIDKYPAVKEHLLKHEKALKARSMVKDGSCQWYELRPCSYYWAFSNPKIFWPDIAKIPRFSWDSQNLYSNDKGFFVIAKSKSLLAMLNSRVSWFALSQMATPLRLRGGLWQYQSKIQFVERLPIPALRAEQESNLASIAETITAKAGERYQVHQNFRQILSDEFGGGQGIGSQIDLYQWWGFENEAALSDDMDRRSGWNAIPLGKRGEWRKFLADEKTKHQALTNEIIHEEICLNDIVYDAFGLDSSERQLIETATKYPYGEV